MKISLLLIFKIKISNNIVNENKHFLIILMLSDDLPPSAAFEFIPFKPIIFVFCSVVILNLYID